MGAPDRVLLGARLCARCFVYFISPVPRVSPGLMFVQVGTRELGEVEELRDGLTISC